MRLIHCPQIAHKDEKKRRTALYSAHMHPLRNLLATAGIDTNIRLWSLDEPGPELVSTLTLHNGAVLCVRFSPDGQFLASSSDGDNVVVIWELAAQQSGQPLKVFGTQEINKEAWRCRIRLHKHQSDVVHIDWSPSAVNSNGMSFLATCALDGKILIWDCELWDCVKSLNGHSNFVKGIAWDPAGQYIASASDDGSVIMWELPEFQLIKRITGPFQKEFGSVFFRRGSWSPDGFDFCAVHACDESGLVTTLSVIKRHVSSSDTLKQWQEDACLVGHRYSSECSAYNPQLFQSLDSEGHCTLLAIGTQDGSVSFWLSDKSRAVLVLENVFGDSSGVFDMGWSADGTLLHCVGGNGYVLIVSLCDDLKQSCSGGQSFGLTKSQRPPEVLPIRPSVRRPISAGLETIFGVIADFAVLRDRIFSLGVTPVFKMQADSATADKMLINVYPELLAANVAPSLDQTSALTNAQSFDIVTTKGKSNRFAQLMDENTSIAFKTFDINTGNPEVDTKIRINKMINQQVVTLTKDGKRRVQPTVLSSPHRNDVSGQQSFYTAQTAPPTQNVVIHKYVADLPIELAVPELKAKIQEYGSNQSIYCVVDQPARRGISKVTYNAPSRSACWQTYTPAPVNLLKLYEKFVVAFTNDCSMLVWSISGRKFFPSVKTDAQVSICVATDSRIACITKRGSFWMWTIYGEAVLTGSSLAHLLLSEKTQKTITKLKVTDNGVPMLFIDDYFTYMFDFGLASWTAVQEHAEFERLYNLPARPVAQQAQSPDTTSLKNIFTDLKSQHFRLNEIRVGVTLSKLEDEMYVAISLQDSAAYCRSLNEYCKLLGSLGEDGVSRSIELCKQLTDSSHYIQERLLKLNLDGPNLFKTVVIPLLAQNIRLQPVLKHMRTLISGNQLKTL